MNTPIISEVVIPFSLVMKEKRNQKQKLTAELPIGGRRVRNRGLLRVEKRLRKKKREKNINEIDGTGD
jgi:hypothetical protein